MALINEADIAGSVIELKRKLVENRAEWKQKFIENRRFYRGEHWTETQKALLSKANAQPFSTNDYYAAIRDKKGQIVRGKPVISAYPRDNDDVDVANFYRDLISYLLYINRYDLIEDKALTDSLCGGVGWIECLWNPLKKNRRGEVELIYQDALDIMFDPESKMPDFSDGEFVMKVLEIPRERAAQFFPQIKDRLLSSPPYRPEVSTTETEDYERNFEESEAAIIRTDRVEVIELWLKEYGTWAMMQYMGDDPDQMLERKVIWEEVDDDEDLKAAMAENPDYDVVEIQDHRIRIISTAGGIEAQDEWSEYAHNTFPLVPIIGIPTDTGYPTSQGEQVKESQKMNNMLYSLLIAQMTSTSNPVTVLAKGLVDKNMIKKIEQGGAHPGAIWTARPPLREAVLRLGAEGVDPNIHLMLQWLDAKTARLFGVRGSLRGEREEGVKSGRMLQMLISQASQSITSDTLPLASARRALGQLIVSNIQQFYTPDRAVRIVGRSRQQAVMDQQVLPYDLKVGAFDIIVGDVSAQPSNRLEEFMFLIEISNILAQQGMPIDYETLIEAAPLTNKEQILRRLQEREQRMMQLQLGQEQQPTAGIASGEF